MYAYRINWVRVGFKTFAILGLIVIAIVNYAPLKIDLKPEAWAAWVQAIGSILAILTAVLIPALQHATTKRDGMRPATSP
ncbi:hypothetical protein [Pseudoxanthomonas mexicana]